MANCIYYFFYSFQARSLGYIVVGVNEYYTSKKCPVCTEFVGQVDIRRLYCTKCQKYMHRDIMAGHNIANAVQGHLLEQQRPLYLQPVDSDGKYPWMQDSRGSKPRRGGSGSGGKKGVKRKAMDEVTYEGQTKRTTIA